jgi:hypothetical protein
MRLTRAIAASILFFIAAHESAASILLVDTHHDSAAGGVWNNSNQPNWAIWYDLAGNPNDANPRPFVNEPDPLTQDVTIPDGTSNYVLYKNSYNTNDVNNVFDFQNGALTGSITVPGAGAYRTNNGPIPAFANPPSLTLGNTTVKILAFGWYDPTVFNKDIVSTQQTLGANGTLDDIAMVTFQVVPEPAALLLAGIGGLLALAFRRKTAS